MKRKIRTPFFMINIKSYIYGKEALELAQIADRLSEKYDIDVIYTAQAVDIQKIRENTKHIILCAQYMDSLIPGRGMGHVLPDALKAAGTECVTLNHAEKPLLLSELDKTMRRADELDMITIVCADTVEQCKAVAQLKPDIMICEPTSLIGTGQTSDDEYIRNTNEAIKAINENIMIIQAAGVSTGDDVYRVIIDGAHGTGGTSGILNAPDREEKIIEMIEAIKAAEKVLSAAEKGR